MNAKIKFLIVGGFAFIVDASVYLILTGELQHSPLNARVLAFTIAVLVTCTGNRFITFANRIHQQFYKQYAMALLAGLISLLPNLVVFMGLLFVLPNTIVFELFAFMCGTIIGIISNFVLSDKLVFAENP